MTSMHRPFEDVAAMLTGTLMVALGVTFYSTAGLLTGGTAGLALSWECDRVRIRGLAFFAINLPFYYLPSKGWAGSSH